MSPIFDQEPFLGSSRLLHTVVISESALRLAALGLYITVIELNEITRPPSEHHAGKALQNLVLFDQRTEAESTLTGFVPGSLGDAVDRARFDRSFDVVLGNPPWTRLNGKAKSQVDNAGTLIARRVLESRGLKELAETYQNPGGVPDMPFLWRAMEWAKPGGIIAFALERHILGTVLGLIAKKNFSLNEEDNPDPARLLLVNLASAWEALPNMQSEFRRWFARFVRPENLDELDLHERSTFRHLWAVAFAVVHSPLEQISGGAATLEKSFEQRRISFLDQLNKELRAVMAEIGTVRIDVGPHLIDGKRCLVVICDHASPGSFGKATPEIVQAIWRASQFGGWRPQEWTPLLIEWPYIFVTHLIRGRAILPVGVHLSSSVLFSTASDFQVCAHHMIALSVPDADFRALGLRLWENPLVMAALRLQGGLYAFAFTLPRFAAIAEVVLDYGLPKEAVEHSLTAFSREITTLLNLGIDEYKDLADLLHNFRDSSAAFSGLADGWLARWECICRALLLSIKPDADLVLTLDGFVEWTTSAGAGMEQSNALLLEMVDFALSTEAKDENGNVI